MGMEKKLSGRLKTRPGQGTRRMAAQRRGYLECTGYGVNAQDFVTTNDGHLGGRRPAHDSHYEDLKFQWVDFKASSE
jgi:hypothetical protein